MTSPAVLGLVGLACATALRWPIMPTFSLSAGLACASHDRLAGAGHVTGAVL